MTASVKISGTTIHMKDIITPEFIDIMSKVEGTLESKGCLILVTEEVTTLNASIRLLLTILSENAALFNSLDEAGLLEFNEPVPAKNLH